jgi:hypothetical protein
LIIFSIRVADPTDLLLFEMSSALVSIC